MKSGINIEIPKVELNHLFSDLKKYDTKKRKEIVNEINGTLTEILSDAKSNAGSNFTSSKPGTGIAGAGHAIYVKEGKEQEGEVYFQRHYAPYIEFGTGKNVFQGSNFSFTNEMKQYASQFRRGGKRNPNLKAKPYLFPAFIENTKDLVNRIQKILSKV